MGSSAVGYDMTIVLINLQKTTVTCMSVTQNQASGDFSTDREGAHEVPLLAEKLLIVAEGKRESFFFGSMATGRWSIVVV